jgi:nucleotide-binding universal stress UspA family protein
MLHETITAPRPSVRQRHTHAGEILACTPGDAATGAVLRTAHRLSRGAARPVHVLAALEPLPVGTVGFEVIPPPAVSEEERRGAMLDDVRRHLLADIGPDAVWGVEVRGGPPPRVIAQAAAERDAWLIVMGLGRHAIVDRLLGTETALHTMRVARTPVLAVPAAGGGAMHTAIVAMDFSPASIRAARVALACLEAPATLTLVHVIPRLETPPFVGIEWDEAYERELPRLFERAIEAIGAPAEVRVETATLRGDAALELLAHAEHQRADLIALGRRGLGAFERLLVGSVTTRVLRGSTRAVLTAPTPAPAEADEIERVMTRLITSDEPARWDERLADFTRRNAGRRTSLEVDDPSLGAQSQQTGYPLRGVAYDRHDRRVEVMLGADDAEGPHLTRSIAGVDAISILNGADRRDRALRIAHGRGQTIVQLID